VDTELASRRVPSRSALRRPRVLERTLAGFSYGEIMELLGVTYTNVNRHLTEARAELREAA
jgi:DNA-directed RNA polymerase specialized sigma24 family protein